MPGLIGPGSEAFAFRFRAFSGGSTEGGAYSRLSCLLEYCLCRREINDMIDEISRRDSKIPAGIVGKETC